jgi:transcription initiation protein SPT3
MYQQEISQMMFVVGQVQEPLEETLQLVEDIVRTQIIQIIASSAQQTAKRNSRVLTIDDLLFLIRHDKQKIQRLRSFLSWKDVRKNLKGSDTPTDNEDSDSKKIQKLPLFSWDPLSTYLNILDVELESEDEYIHDHVAHRLKVADQVTVSMNKEEYIFYSECRQASFTYRKTKRFIEW